MRQVANRTYYVNVPAGLSGPSVPLLLGLHGAGQPPRLHEHNTGWSGVAAAKRFIIAYPEANRLVWDAARDSGDVTYLRAVVGDISRTWCVNPRQIYAEGHSSGAVMAARLACDAPTVFASVAGYGGGDPELTGTSCDPQRPIAVGLFQGNTDPISTLPSAIQHRNHWLHRNACPSTPTTEPGVVVEASSYGPCRAGVEVVWRVYQGGHFWPSGADHTDITQRMWNFFQRNPLPTSAAK
jgi:polyhydroxybutyrate depolymerase